MALHDPLLMILDDNDRLVLNEALMLYAGALDITAVQKGTLLASRSLSAPQGRRSAARWFRESPQ